MKKLFIGLLIIAAGAGIFFYLRSKQIKIADSPETEDSSTLFLKKAE